MIPLRLLSRFKGDQFCTKRTICKGKRLNASAWRARLKKYGSSFWQRLFRMASRAATRFYKFFTSSLKYLCGIAKWCVISAKELFLRVASNIWSRIGRIGVGDDPPRKPRPILDKVNSIALKIGKGTRTVASKISSCISPCGDQTKPRPILDKVNSIALKIGKGIRTVASKMSSCIPPSIKKSVRRYRTKQSTPRNWTAEDYISENFFSEKDLNHILNRDRREDSTVTPNLEDSQFSDTFIDFADSNAPTTSPALFDDDQSELSDTEDLGIIDFAKSMEESPRFNESAVPKQQLNDTLEFWCAPCDTSIAEPSQGCQGSSSCGCECSKLDEIEIFIHGLSSKTNVTRINAFATVSELKTKIRESVGIPESLQNLLHNGHPVCGDERMIATFDIKQESAVHVSLRVAGGMDSSTNKKSSSDQPIERPRNTNANNVANKRTMPEAVRKRKAEEAVIDDEYVSPLTRDEANGILFNYALSGKCKFYDKTCCLQELFRSKDGPQNISLDDACDNITKCRSLISNKTNQELDNFLMEKFRTAIKSETVMGNGNIKFNYSWKLLDDREVCRDCFQTAFGSTKYEIDRISKALKQSDTRRVSSSNIKAYSEAEIFEYTIADVEKIFEENLDESPDPVMVRCTLTPLAAVQQDAILWLEQYFEKYGDCVPNKDLVNLMIMMKRDIFNQYVADQKKKKESHIAEPRFNVLWGTIFPRFVKRPMCNQIGKCDTCYEIDRLRRCCEDEKIQRKLKEAHAMHRGGLFMLERRAYKARVAEALADQMRTGGFPKIMSIIIDGMDQNHCKIPYLGTQQSFNSPLKQCITGVKEHGIGLTIYRTLNNVNKGADLTIHCILLQLESFYMRNGCYPEKIYIQVDGGAENANFAVLAMLELLVIKRMCREIYYSRLPTGHTHEDIDGCFGVIWKTFGTTVVESLSSYKKRIEDRFRDTNLRATVIDIMLLPNYTDFLEDHHDSKLSRLHKEEHTQHQWRFEAVEPHPTYFPHGCKVTYRAYSSDRVVEFYKKPQDQCKSKIGKATGLEPVTVHCRWYPSKICDPSRKGVEGCYLLKSIPHAELGSLPPVSFPDDAKQYIDTTITEVRQKFLESDVANSTVRMEWEEWISVYVPETNSAEDYIQQLRRNRVPNGFHIPFKMILLNRKEFLSASQFHSNKPLSNATDEIDPGFVWPEVLAAAMPSVVTEFNPHPPAPRWFTTTDVGAREIQESFENETKGFYNTIEGGRGGYLNNFNVADLKAMLRRHFSHSGEEQLIPSTKKTIIKRISDSHRSFYSIYSRVMSDIDTKDYLAKKILAPITTQEAELKTVSTIEVNPQTRIRPANMHAVTQADMRQFRPNQKIEASGMNAILALLRKRDAKRCSVHKDVNSAGQYYKPCLKSLFCPPFNMNINTAALTVAISRHVLTTLQAEENLPSSKVYKIYIPLFKEGEDEWKILLLDTQIRSIFYMDFSGENPPTCIRPDYLDELVVTLETDLANYDLSVTANIRDQAKASAIQAPSEVETAMNHLQNAANEYYAVLNSIPPKSCKNEWQKLENCVKKFVVESHSCKLKLTEYSDADDKCTALSPTTSSLQVSIKIQALAAAGVQNSDTARAISDACANQAAATSQLKKAQGEYRTAARTRKLSADEALKAAIVESVTTVTDVINRLGEVQQGVAANIGATVENGVDNAVAQQVPNIATWGCTFPQPYSFCKGGQILNNFDSGITVACALYMMASDCCVFIDTSSILQFRSSFAYWILNGSLPT